VCVFAASTLLFVAPSHAGKIVLTVSAGNPIGTAQKTPVEVDLPPGIGTNDIIDLGGLQLGYNVAKDIYYVYKDDLELGPKEIRTFNVELNDVWVISKKETDELRKRSLDLAGKLKGKKDYETAELLGKQIEKNLGEIDASQAQNSLAAGAKKIQHIKAYESDLLVMKRVKIDIRRVENMVLALGVDPGGLVDDSRIIAPLRRNQESARPDARIVIDRIIVHNKSPNEAQRIPLRRDLPPEVKAADIQDSAGLDVGIDPRNNVTYVQKSDLVLGTNATISFDVKIKDRWNVNGPRIPALQASASNLLERIALKGKFTSIVDRLHAIEGELDDISKEHGPAEFNDKYIEYYRRQSDRVDVIEQKIARIEAALRPIEVGSKLGFNLKPPSTKSTWLVIYIVLGFLALMSLLFFLSWFGRSKAEKMEDSPPPADEK
jgi:hypothetical protein